MRGPHLTGRCTEQLNTWLTKSMAKHLASAWLTKKHLVSAWLTKSLTKHLVSAWLTKSLTEHLAY